MTRLMRDVSREALERARAEMAAYADDPPSSGRATGIAIGVGAVAAAILIGFALWAIWSLA